MSQECNNYGCVEAALKTQEGRNALRSHIQSELVMNALATPPRMETRKKLLLFLAILESVDSDCKSNKQSQNVGILPSDVEIKSQTLPIIMRDIENDHMFFADTSSVQ